MTICASASLRTNLAPRRLHFLACACAILTGSSLPAQDQPAATDLVAHEWGTFTSIQGGDGQLLYWNGVETAELPKFVYNWTHPGLGRFMSGQFQALTKQSFAALQRMETPVIYFYSQKPRRVSVSVEFPQGTITEWFPQARTVGPSARPPNSLLRRLDQWTTRSGISGGFSFVKQFGEKPVTNSVIQWDKVQVLPNWKTSSTAGDLPIDGSGNHYFAARETDANLLRIASLEKTNRTPELEKFLFYRGVGQFQSPLKVTMGDDGTITISNLGVAPLKHLIALRVKGIHASFVRLDQLEPGASTSLLLEPEDHLSLEDAADAASRRMVAGLASEGLFQREAEAMVKTWRAAWFTAPGTRVLYVLPPRWTDSILPMDIRPTPSRLVRVMVGRAELITPAMEQAVRDCIHQFQQEDKASRELALERFKSIGLGRFATPAINLAIQHSTDAAFSRSAISFQQAIRSATTPPAQNHTAQSSSGRSTPNDG